MATFKVGQRVRKVEMQRPEDNGGLRYLGSPLAPIGTEGTVVALRNEACAVDVAWDGYPSRGLASAWRVMLYQLAPLTDPKADAFVESLKKLAREPQNIPERVS